MDPVKRENTNPNFKHLFIFFCIDRLHIEISRKYASAIDKDDDDDVKNVCALSNGWKCREQKENDKQRNLEKSRFAE